GPLRSAGEECPCDSILVGALVAPRCWQPARCSCWALPPRPGAPRRRNRDAAAPRGVAAATYRACSGLTLAAGADLHRCDISGTTFIGEDLAGVNLARANLSGVVGGCAPDEPRTNLTGAVIYRAVATGARLCDAILTSADLHGTDFRNASFEDATL